LSKGGSQEEWRAAHALRLIADGRADYFLWDGWDDGIETVFDVTSM